MLSSFHFKIFSSSLFLSLCSCVLVCMCFKLMRYFFTVLSDRTNQPRNGIIWKSHYTVASYRWVEWTLKLTLQDRQNPKRQSKMLRWIDVDSAENGKSSSNRCFLNEICDFERDKIELLRQLSSLPFFTTQFNSVLNFCRFIFCDIRIDNW